IVFLSACYFLVSLGYLIRVGVGHENIACDGPSIKYSVNGLSLCSLVFLFVYFFGMASSIWWVVLSFTWFLAAGLKWGNEAISSFSQYYHLFAWFIPTAQTVAVLLSGAVDGDPIAGICYVGNMNMENLRTFVLAPLVVYLLLGTTFLFAGFVSLFRIRNVIKKQGGVGVANKTDKLEKLMIRIGIFSVLYTVPATIVIACYLYENMYHDVWLKNLACPCKNSNSATTFREKPLYSVVMLKYFMTLAVGITSGREKPLYSVVMLKYFMTLAVGITSGVWIWTGK
nr:frizzled 2 [Cucujiformia]